MPAGFKAKPFNATRLAEKHSKIAMKPFQSKMLTINKLLQEAYDRRNNVTPPESNAVKIGSRHTNHAVRMNSISSYRSLRSLSSTLSSSKMGFDKVAADEKATVKANQSISKGLGSVLPDSI